MQAKYNVGHPVSSRKKINYAKSELPCYSPLNLPKVCVGAFKTWLNRSICYESKIQSRCEKVEFQAQRRLDKC